MLDYAHGAPMDRDDVIKDIATRIERIRNLAANSDIGGEAEGHQISHECRHILSRIAALH